MGFLRVATVGAVSFGLIACQPTGGAPVSTNSDIATLDAAMLNATTDIALSGVMSDNCSSVGIGRKADDETDITAFFETMKAQGYSQDQINTSVAKISEDQGKVAGARIIDYLAARDVRLLDTEALCNLARREISEGTSVGNLLVVR